MKSKKGFTLVEIIVVVAILVVIAGIFSINMISTLNKNKDEENKNVVTQITSAADAYVSANPEKVERLYNGFGYVDIKVGELRDEGLLSEALKNAETGERISDDEIVRVRLELGDYVGFTYPLTEEEQNAQAWSMVADDLTIDYSPSTTSAAWCSNNKNKYSGLYDSAYVNKSDYANVTSKLYLMDNSAEGKMFDKDYFADAKLEATSCNVNPQVSGTYNITYKYTDPSLNVEKTFNRTVYVRTSGNDVISFTATINNNKKIILGARNVPITIVETYKDGSTSKFESTDSTLGSINYAIEGFTTATSGTRTATVTTTKTNSDGSKPAAQRPSYTVTDSLVEIITEGGDCTPNNGGTCYFRCSQSSNYVRYNGYIYRMYGMSGNTVKLIYSGTEITSPYGQVGDCTSHSCCNGGRSVYNRLGQTASVPSPTMDTVLDNFYYNKSVSGSRLQSQSTRFGSKKVALLSKDEYAEISKSCPSNYLTGTSFWLIEDAGSAVGSGTYNKGRNAAYAYNYAVSASGSVITDGASKGTTFEGDFGTANVKTSRLAVRPTVFLNNPSVSSGNGTASNPYVLR